jgi:hypothetical protein
MTFRPGDPGAGTAGGRGVGVRSQDVIPGPHSPSRSAVTRAARRASVPGAAEPALPPRCARAVAAASRAHPDRRSRPPHRPGAPRAFGTTSGRTSLPGPSSAVLGTHRPAASAEDAARRARSSRRRPPGPPPRALRFPFAPPPAHADLDAHSSTRLVPARSLGPQPR